jgi:hypothetical protein
MLLNIKLSISSDAFGTFGLLHGGWSSILIASVADTAVTAATAAHGGVGISDSGTAPSILSKIPGGGAEKQGGQTRCGFLDMGEPVRTSEWMMLCCVSTILREHDSHINVPHALQ